MSNVHELDDRRGPWFTVLAMCVPCSHRWIGCLRPGTPLFNLECPSCGAAESFASFPPQEYLDALPEEPSEGAQDADIVTYRPAPVKTRPRAE